MIRPARPADAPAIAALLRAAFGGTAKADLVAALRAAGDAAIDLAAQGQRIGTALVRAGLDLAMERPEGWCLVLGAARYHARFGFAAAGGRRRLRGALGRR